SSFFVSWNLRALRSAASLKHEIRVTSRSSAHLSPRSSERGLVEARLAGPTLPASRRSPRSSERGLVEAPPGGRLPSTPYRSPRSSERGLVEASAPDVR